jgi:hypothetical protein
MRRGCGATPRSRKFHNSVLIRVVGRHANGLPHGRFSAPRNLIRRHIKEGFLSHRAPSITKYGCRPERAGIYLGFHRQRNDALGRSGALGHSQLPAQGSRLASPSNRVGLGG